MRVISGVSKGLRLSCLEGMDTRPTTDRVKESMFNLIGFACNGARVCDLFSGTGALGIEALSRGASGAVLVDASKSGVAVIQSNLVHTRLKEKAEVLCASWDVACEKLVGQCFDLIFLDPPYGKGWVPKVLDAIFAHKLLCDGGQVVIEWDFEDKEPLSNAYRTVKERKYGRTWVTIVALEEITHEEDRGVSREL